jgi:hypothetical protein
VRAHLAPAFLRQRSGDHVRRGPDVADAQHGDAARARKPEQRRDAAAAAVVRAAALVH